MRREFDESNVEETLHACLLNTYSEAEMANNFKKIELHFDTPKGRHRAIVLPEAASVQAIFLGGAESKFLPGIKAKRQPPPETSVLVEPPDLTANEMKAIGPGVCYLINGELHCW